MHTKNNNSPHPVEHNNFYISFWWTLGHEKQSGPRNLKQCALIGHRVFNLKSSWKKPWIEENKKPPSGIIAKIKKIIEQLTKTTDIYCGQYWMSASERAVLSLCSVCGVDASFLPPQSHPQHCIRPGNKTRIIEWFCVWNSGCFNKCFLMNTLMHSLIYSSSVSLLSPLRD